MNQNLFSLSQLALDLKRSAIGSEKSRRVFINEVINNKKKLFVEEFPGYIQKVLKNIDLNTDKEDLLMYSVLLQNYGRSK